MSNRPLLALTLGDPAGIGPEICLKAAADRGAQLLADLLIVGPVPVVRRTAAWVGASGRVYEVTSPQEVRNTAGMIPVLNAGNVEGQAIIPGQLSAAAGAAAVAAVETATRVALAGEVDAIVTAPLNKEAMRLAGVSYPGHTEILGALTGAPAATMLLITPRLRVLHVSVHVSLREAIERVERERVLRTIHTTVAAAAELGIERPRIAVAGLNPHAGEGGLFGTEDRDEIAPAVEAARAEGHDVTGPWPPDTVFLRGSQGEFDFVVAMYHDQGHIPVKMFGLEGGVNVTLGLPIIRTSVDHGTAFDIAGKGVAQHASMLEAIRVAVQMVQARAARRERGA